MNIFEELYHRIEQEEVSLWEPEKVHLKRNEYLKRPGKTDTNMYFIEEGCLRVSLDTEEEEHTIRFGYDGNFFGALDSFISEKPSPMSIQALKASTLRVIRKPRFIEWLTRDEEQRALWQRMLLLTVYQQHEREVDLLTSSPQERYNRVMKRSPHLFQHVPAKYIASYLRMTPETLSRIRKY